MSSSFSSFLQPTHFPDFPHQKKKQMACTPSSCCAVTARNLGQFLLKNHFYLFWRIFFVAVGKALFSVNGKLFNRQCLIFLTHPVFPLSTRQHVIHESLIGPLPGREGELSPCVQQKRLPDQFSVSISSQFRSSARAWEREATTIKLSIPLKLEGKSRKNFFFKRNYAGNRHHWKIICFLEVQ